jgi:hypothetical protein
MMTVEQLMDSHDCFKPYGIEDFKGYIKDVDKRILIFRYFKLANNLVYFLTVLAIYFLLRPHNGSMQRFKESPFKKLQVIITSL